LNMHPVNGPEVIVPFAHEKFDATGKVTWWEYQKVFDTIAPESCKLDKEINKKRFLSID
jgi:hypothetical protein